MESRSPVLQANSLPSELPGKPNTNRLFTLVVPKLKLQYFGHVMRRGRADSLERAWCWERLKAGREGDDRGRDGWMASSTQWTWVWASYGRWWRTGKPGVLRSVGSQSQTGLSNWTISCFSIPSGGCTWVWHLYQAQVRLCFQRNEKQEFQSNRLRVWQLLPGQVTMYFWSDVMNRMLHFGVRPPKS